MRNDLEEKGFILVHGPGESPSFWGREGGRDWKVLVTAKSGAGRERSMHARCSGVKGQTYR